MKSRPGILLLDALLGLLILCSLAAACFPLIFQGVRALEMVGQRNRVESEGLFAMDFMVEKIRNNLNPSPEGSWKGGTYIYYANVDRWDQKQKKWVATPKPYTFLLNKEKLYLKLYTGSLQPITGDSGNNMEDFAAEPIEDQPLFSKEGQGPLHMAFRIRNHMTGAKKNFETALVPYADYYRLGEEME